MTGEKDIWNEDVYSLLGIQPSASERDIVKAYRKQALKVHPDKNPDNEEASKLFHRLTKAYELLKDPVKKRKFDEDRKIKEEKQQRLASLDENRRRMREDLERREAAHYKKMKETDSTDRNISKMKIEQIREENQKKMKEMADIFRSDSKDIKDLNREEGHDRIPPSSDKKHHPSGDSPSNPYSKEYESSILARMKATQQSKSNKL